MLWLTMAVLSALFAGLTSILAKCGIRTQQNSFGGFTSDDIRNARHGNMGIKNNSQFNQTLSGVLRGAFLMR